MNFPQARELLGAQFDSPGQAWLTRWLSQPLGRGIAALACLLGLSPNTLTIVGLLISLLGCWVFATWPSDLQCLVMAVVLFQLAFGFDCADGQLARALGRASPFGAWLDIASDFVRQAGLSLAVLLGLLRLQIPMAWACLVVFCFLAGQLVYLHTAYAINVHEPPKLKGRASNRAGFFRSALVNLTDTPVLLLIIPALAPWPWVLSMYLACYGGLLLLRGGLLGLLRIGRAG